MFNIVHLIVSLCLLDTMPSSQCQWTVIIPGQNVTLDLSPLDGLVLNATDSDQLHTFLFTPCQNNVTCDSTPVMTAQHIPDDPGTCYVIGTWDQFIEPAYDSSNGGTWTFEYANGANDCGNPCRTWAPRFICTPGVKYRLGAVEESPGSCYYTINIETEFACPEWTTTTTSIPTSECVFKSETGNTLNMTSIKGHLLSAPDDDMQGLYFMYTPCVNQAKCVDNTYAMAYTFDSENFMCKQFLAIWEDGIVEPNYIEGIRAWQFVYENGESCDGGNTVFIAEWLCDQSAMLPAVVQAKQMSQCVYQMIINSSFACG